MRTRERATFPAACPAASQGSSIPCGTRLSTHELPQLCQNPAQLPLAEVTEVPPWTWGLSLGLSKTLMVSGGSCSNICLLLSVHLQLCLRITTPPGHHSCHNSDTFFPFPSRALNTLCIPSCSGGHGSPCTPLGCPFSRHHLQMRTKRRNLSVQDWEESSSERMLGQCSDCSTAQTHVQPSTETWAKTAREELWLCPCHAQVSRALLSASGGHAKPPSAPSLFPHSRISRDAAKPLLNSGAASSRGSLGLTREIGRAHV